MNAKFANSFTYFVMSDDWMYTLHLYVIHGVPPGGFFEHMLANNFVGMANSSHPANQWREIMQVGKWLQHEAPDLCWGSRDKVDAWMKLSQDERRKICEEAGLLETMWDILSTPADKPTVR